MSKVPNLYKKIITGILTFSVLTLIFVFLYINYKSIEIAKQKVLSYNNKVLHTIYGDIKVKFNKKNVECKKDNTNPLTKINYECEIKNVLLEIPELKKDFVKISKVNLIYNINQKTLTNVELDKINLINDLKDKLVIKNKGKEIEKETQEIYSYFFPLNIYLKKQQNLDNFKIYLALEDKLLELKSNIEIFRKPLQEGLSVSISNNGHITKDNNNTAKLNFPKRKYAILLRHLSFDIKDKAGMFPLLYKIYKLNIKATNNPVYVNNQLLGVLKNKVFSFKEFQTLFLERTKQFKRLNLSEVGKKSVDFIIGNIKGEKHILSLDMTPKKSVDIPLTGLMLELSTAGNKMDIFAKYYNIKITTK